MFSTLQFPHLLLSASVSIIVASCSHTTGQRDVAAEASWDSGGGVAASDYALPSSATIADLVTLAIAHNPGIQAARHRAHRLAQQAPQERALPDPMLQAASGSMAETAAGQVLATGSLNQKIPFPGKRREAAAAASSEAQAATAEVQAMELRLEEQMRAAWWDLFLADQTIEITEESRSVLEVLLDSVGQRVAADQASQADQIRLGNELTMIDRDLSEARQLRDTAKARLNSLLNRPAKASLPPAGKSAIPDLSALEDLLAQAEARHPEVRAAERRVEAFRHRLERAELERFPDFTFGVGGAAVSDSGLSSMANGRDQVYASLGINIPLWQEPRRAMIAAAREGISETEALRQNTRAELRYRIQDAWFQARTAREVDDLFESRLIPDAAQAYEVTLTGYTAGTADFTELLDTWRETLSYRLQQVRNQALLGKAQAALRAAAGIH